MNRSVVVFIVLFFFVIDLSFAQENANADAINNTTHISLGHKAKISKERKVKLWQGWSAGLNFGVTKFQGDVNQYDHYPAYQEAVNFSELRTAIAVNFEKKINSFYSLATELSIGRFAGLRRSNEYAGYNVYDPWISNYEGNGDKFVASFSEVDLLISVNLTNAMSYFRKSRRSKKIYFNGKLGMGV